MKKTEDQKIVVVMGATGSGKSLLVRLATGDESVQVGDSLKSATKEITSYQFHLDEALYCLVDTPGFDDTYDSDQKVLESISKWLADSYREGSRVSAVLYVHRISDSRMQGSAVNNFRIFRALCGEDFGSRILLCTTFWDLYERSPEIPAQRLEELQGSDDFWGEMCKMGSSVCKAPASQTELQNLIATLAKPKGIPLKIQHEVVDEGKSVNETSAMLSLFQVELDRQRQEHQKDLEDAKTKFEEEKRAREKKMAEDFETMQHKFEAQLKAQRDEHEKTAAEMKRRLSEQAPRVSTIPRPPLPPRRAQTDLKSPLDTKIKTRRQKTEEFVNASKSTINVLVTGKNNGHVRCDLNPVKPCYSVACDNCLMTIGNKKCFECKLCTKDSGSGEFILCESCYNDSSVICNAEQHDKAAMSEKWLLELPSRCPWINTPPQDRRMICVKCGQNIGICYLHCCNCNESWDMCVNCAIKGKHCPGHRRTFPRTPHRMEICFRYIGDR